MGIVVIGATLVDIKGYPYDQYNPTGRNTGRIIQVHGGVCRNIAEDIANVELRPVFVSLVDHSGLGEDCIRKLEKHKVNVDYIRKTEDGLGTWMAIFDNSGDVAGSISKRPNFTPVMDIFEKHGDEIFSQADAVVLQVDLAKDIVKKTIELSKKYGKKLFALVSNMSIAIERRDFMQDFDCFICNRQEAGLLFSDDYSEIPREELKYIIAEKIERANIPAMIVTLGGEGAVYATSAGEKGACPAIKVVVKDTTGAGDAFCAGASIGLTYGKTFEEAIQIGSRLAASVITSSENVCPRFLPREFGIDIDVEGD